MMSVSVTYPIIKSANYNELWQRCQVNVTYFNIGCHSIHLIDWHLIFCYVDLTRKQWLEARAPSQYKDCLSRYVDSQVKDETVTRIPIPVRRCLYIETAPCRLVPQIFTWWHNSLISNIYSAGEIYIYFHYFLPNFYDIEKTKNRILIVTLRWRLNGRDGGLNHQPRDCLLNRLFGRRSKKTSKLRVTGLCVGNSPGTGEFPAQMASYAEDVSIWWRHHDLCWRLSTTMPLS